MGVLLGGTMHYMVSDGENGTELGSEVTADNPPNYDMFNLITTQVILNVPTLVVRNGVPLDNAAWVAGTCHNPEVCPKGDTTVRQPRRQA